MMNRILAATLFAAFSLVALDGCKNQLDNKKLEGAITDGLKAKGVALKSVSCPSDRQAKSGDKFTCDAVTDGGDKLVVNVEQTDDQGNVNWKVDNLPAPKGAAGDKAEEKPAGDKPAEDEHK